MLSSINSKFLTLGNGLIAKVKYDLTFNLDIFKFLQLRFEKKEEEKKKLAKRLYKPIS